MTTTLPIIIYLAIAIIPQPITFGLPNCVGSTSGLTERYDPAHQTLYVDECRNGVIIEPNLPVVDMTTSFVIIETSKGRVAVLLPEPLEELPFAPTPVTVQSSGVPGNPDGAAPEVDCNKVKMLLDTCVMGPRP